MPERMLVTGASGFVGGAIARAAVAAGYAVVTSSRRPAAVSGARHVAWDLDTDEQPESVRRRVGDVDVVVHAAAFVGEGGRTAAVRRTSVGGTRAVLGAFPAARLVHISSASVYDPYRPSVQAREEQAPVTRYLNAYAAAKAAAEVAVLNEAPSGGRPSAVILRPHAVYGPGDTTLLPRVLGAIHGRVLPLPGGGRCLQSLTAIATLTQAVLAACRPGLPSPLVVNVADAEPVVLRAALTELLERRGRHVRILDVPWRLAWHLGHLAETGHRVATAAALTQRSPRVSRYAVSHVAMERTLDLTALRQVLGLDPRPTSFVGAESW